MDKKKLVLNIVKEYLYRGLTSVSNPMPSGGSATVSSKPLQNKNMVLSPVTITRFFILMKKTTIKPI